MPHASKPQTVRRDFQSLETRARPFSNHWKILAVVWLAAITAWGQTAYKVTDLGTLGGKSARTRAVSPDGEVVGEAETKGGELHAFIWTAKDGMKDLGTLGGRLSRAFAINDRCFVVGEAETSNGVKVAFRWSTEAGMTNLALPEGMQGACAYSINHYGAMVGAGETENGGRALRWEMGVVSEVITGGVQASTARAINDDGLIAGQMAASVTNQFASTAFAKTGGPDEPAVTFSVPGGGSTSAQALNKQGVAVGFAEMPDGLVHAVKFSAGVVTDLDTMNNAHSSAAAINDEGDVVGSFFNSGADDDRAFVWRDGEMRDLNELVEEDGWVLVEASGINKRGEIAGYGVKDGIERAVLLTPVESRKKNAVTVTFTQPTNQAVFREPAEIEMSAEVKCEDGLKRVVFRANGEPVGVVSNAPFTFTWRDVRAGDYDLCVGAASTNGVVGRSRHVRIRVTPPPPVE